MNIRGFVPVAKFTKNRRDKIRYISGVHAKILQATVLTEATPLCFTSTGMVVVFRYYHQFELFKQCYTNDRSWSAVQWKNAQTNYPLYKTWIARLGRISEANYPKIYHPEEEVLQ